ncbi:MAG TPA: carbohydrate kinase [Erysipelothrix sp.]|nr:carbohydrate kinase [Erysipelothrix sp.]
MNIYCIGEVLVDTMMDEFPNYEAKFGGAPANVAYHLGKADTKTYFIGNIGNDYLGKYLKGTLETAGINLEYTTFSSKTPLAFVSWDTEGERDFQFYLPQFDDYTVPSISLTKQDLVHFGSAIAFMKHDFEKQYLDFFENVTQSDAIISFDPNYRKDLIEDNDHFSSLSKSFIEKSDFIKMSLEELEIIYGIKSLEEIENTVSLKPNQLLVVTLGEQGSYVLYQNKSSIIPSIEVEQVDSTGAGDAFVAAILYKLTNEGLFTKDNYEDYVRFANAVGAIATTQYGAIESVPNLKTFKL